MHTIVRLPNGVFEPYTPIPTNILFFDRSGATEDIWFYEHPLPEGRKKYTKTSPIQFDEFEPLKQWWRKRSETTQAWKVSADQVLARGANLDLANPNAAGDLERLPASELVKRALSAEHALIRILEEVQQQLASEGA